MFAVACGFAFNVSYDSTMAHAKWNEWDNWQWGSTAGNWKFIGDDPTAADPVAVPQPQEAPGAPSAAAAAGAPGPAGAPGAPGPAGAPEAFVRQRPGPRESWSWSCREVSECGR